LKSAPPPPKFCSFSCDTYPPAIIWKMKKQKFLGLYAWVNTPLWGVALHKILSKVSSPTPNGFSLLAFPLLLLLLKSYLKFLHTRPNISTTPPLSLPFPIFWAQQNESIVKKGTHPPFHFKHYTFLSLWVLLSGEEYARSTPNMVGMVGGPKGGSGLDPMGEGPKPSPNKIK
jgi:hypothetical protein